MARKKQKFQEWKDENKPKEKEGRDEFRKAFAKRKQDRPVIRSSHDRKGE